MSLELSRQLLESLTGKCSLIARCAEGVLRLHNNTAVGVMTNDPTWDWHLQNLNNYVALQPTWCDDSWQPRCCLRN
jgi:penicillin V acylase-like amidase (Ntn superfamily)